MNSEFFVSNTTHKLNCMVYYPDDYKELPLLVYLHGAGERGEKLAMIIPVGPMGMYKWVVYFLKEWKVSCEHVYTFNMDEWADGEGNTLGRGMSWQGMSFLTTLHYGPDMNITSTYMPTLAGKLFYLKELAGPLTAECN